MLDADKLYIITATIKSNKFTFDAKKSDGTDLKVDVPVIQQIVGGNVKIGGETAVNSKLTYEGKIPAYHRVPSRTLFFDEGRYTALKPAQGAMRARAAATTTDSGKEVELLETESAFVRLRDL